MIAHTDKFRQLIDTILFSGGGDPTPESIWAANDLLEWAELENNIKFEIRFSEFFLNYDEVMLIVNKKL